MSRAHLRKEPSFIGLFLSIQHAMMCVYRALLRMYGALFNR